MYPLVACFISYDSTRVITVTKCYENEFYIKMYDIENLENITFEVTIGGGDNQYIKVKDVEQNELGTKFAVTYFDDGKYYLKVFEKSLEKGR